MLLIEDDAVSAHFISEILQRSETRVIWAERLDEGLRHLAAEPISEVLLDLNLPDSSGLATIERLRACAPRLPMVVLTGTDDPELGLKAVRAGADDYLVKGRVNAETIVRVLAYARERWRARDELLEREERYGRIERYLAAIVDSSEDAIFACDTDGNVLTWSRAAESLFGYTRAEMVGSSMASVFPPTEVTQLDRILESTRANEPVSLERRLCRKDNSGIDVDLNVAPLRDGSRAVIGASIVARDVTRKRAGERQREQDERLASLGRTAAAIVHEFNNVLMSIQPFAELIAKRSSDPDVIAFTQKIRQSVARGKSITEEILRFTQPAKPRLQCVHLGRFLQDTIRPELSSFLGSDVELRIEAASPDLAAMIDRHQITQVLFNLAVNAKHAMAGRAACLLIRATPGSETESFAFGVVLAPEQYVHLQVTDTGSGIGAEALQKIFEPFYTTKHRGTGLGLAIVHQIVAAHGGKIFAESEPGTGTSFHIFLPKAAVIEPRAPVSATPTSLVSPR